MAKYRIHDWYYRGARSFPPGSEIEIPDKEEPHPEWERVEGETPKRGRASSRPAQAETTKEPDGPAQRPSDVGV